jgi:hypothetical protein
MDIQGVLTTQVPVKVLLEIERRAKEQKRSRSHIARDLLVKALGLDDVESPPIEK